MARWESKGLKYVLHLKYVLMERPIFILIYLQTLSIVTAEEESLPFVITHCLFNTSRYILTLGVTTANTIVIALFKPLLRLYCRVGKSSKVDGVAVTTANVVIPTYHPLYGVANQVDIDGSWQLISAEIQPIAMFYVYSAWLQLGHPKGLYHSFSRRSCSGYNIYWSFGDYCHVIIRSHRLDEFHQSLTSNFGSTIEKDHLQFRMLSVVQLFATQRSKLWFI